MTETENTNNNNNSDNGGHDGNANNNSNNIYHPPPPLQQQQQVQNHTPQNNNNYNSNKSNNNNNSTAPRRTSLKLQLPDAAHRKAIEAEGGPRLTTTPMTPMTPTPAKSQAPKKKKKKRRDKSDLGDNFVAPDGGWGWLVAIASGVNVLVTFAVGQQFGIIFRDWMFNLGITSSELTSIINLQIAVSAFTGLLNGPLFRRYSYRQVALVGSVLTFLGLFLSVFADSFVFYVCSFSCCYGFGRGLTVSASSLAVNTFFKQKRRTATAYQFGVAGMGPIFLPYFATFLLDFFGVQGTVLIFAGLSLHTIACSLIYQPVKWHVRKPAPDAELQAMAPSAPAPVEDEIEPVAEPETPTLARANDGWFGSRQSLNSLSRTAFRNRLGTWEKEKEAGGQMTELKRLNSRDGSVGSGKPRTFSLSHSIKEEDDDDRDRDRDREVQKKPPPAPPAEVKLHELDEEERKKLPFYKKVVIFFDLDLLRDVTYLNLAVGLTLINFVEINFAILTPFILSDFGFENHQIAMAMSSLGFCDLVIRFLIPAITANLTLSNKTLFIIGITGMCIGRAVLAFTRNFYVMMGVFVWLGLNKAARTVFWSLIIPSYVPLKRLPAAAGLQLLMSGVFSMACGPLIGMIRDRTNFAFTLNFLNAICILAVVMWILEEMFRKYQRKSKPVDTGEAN